MNSEQLNALLSAFQHGNEIANAEQWKVRQASANQLAGLLGTLALLAQLLGVHLPFVVSADLINMLSLGILVLYCAGNYILTLITSVRVGFKKADK